MAVCVQKLACLRHVVECSIDVKRKVRAIKAARVAKHAGFPVLMQVGLMNKEYLQLVLATKKGKMCGLIRFSCLKKV